MRAALHGWLIAGGAGGKFDHGDRLFHDVAHTWRSASAEGGLSDVKELIPEFYYNEAFLVNANK